MDDQGHARGTLDVDATPWDEAQARRFLSAQRLQCLGCLVGGVAHDFNNMLSAVLGNVQLARLPNLPEQRRDRALEFIEETARGSVEVVRQLLVDTGRAGESANAGRLYLDRFIQEASALMRVSLSRRIQQRLTLCSPPPVMADAPLLRQALLNLLSNAMTALDERVDGAVRVRVAPTSRRRGAVGRALEPLPPGDADAPLAMIEVADDGVGMTPDAVEALARVDPSRLLYGQGAGLAATRLISRLHHGGLFVHTTPGAGATFRLLLPGVEETPSPEATTPKTPPRALVVDADEDARARACALLNELGAATSTAQHDIEALKLLRVTPSPVTLLWLGDPAQRRPDRALIEATRALEPDATIVACDDAEAPSAPAAERLPSGWSDALALARLRAVLPPR